MMNTSDFKEEVSQSTDAFQDEFLNLTEEDRQSPIGKFYLNKNPSLHEDYRRAFFEALNERMACVQVYLDLLSQKNESALLKEIDQFQKELSQKLKDYFPDNTKNIAVWLHNKIFELEEALRSSCSVVPEQNLQLTFQTLGIRWVKIEKNHHFPKDIDSALSEQHRSSFSKDNLKIHVDNFLKNGQEIRSFFMSQAASSSDSLEKKHYEKLQTICGYLLRYLSEKPSKKPLHLFQIQVLNQDNDSLASLGPIIGQIKQSFFQSKIKGLFLSFNELQNFKDLITLAWEHRSFDTSGNVEVIDRLYQTLKKIFSNPRALPVSQNHPSSLEPSPAKKKKKKKKKQKTKNQTVQTQAASTSSGPIPQPWLLLSDASLDHPSAAQTVSTVSSEWLDPKDKEVLPDSKGEHPSTVAADDKRHRAGGNDQSVPVLSSMLRPPAPILASEASPSRARVTEALRGSNPPGSSQAQMLNTYGTLNSASSKILSTEEERIEKILVEGSFFREPLDIEEVISELETSHRSAPAQPKPPAPQSHAPGSGPLRPR